MIFYNEAGLVNFVCIVFEQGVKMLTLSSMEKVRKRAKIRNRYNQAPHLTKDTNGKVTTSR